MLAIVLSFLTAFTLTYFAVPSIINIALTKNLCDEPDERRAHEVRTPSLGGIGIFAGMLFSIVLWTPFSEFNQLQYMLCSFMIIFLIGAKDDISPIAPNKKLIGQILAAAILVFKSGILLSGFYGVFGLHNELGLGFNIFLSFFTILVLVNGFNLIDGINGLAGSLGCLIIGTLGCWFFIIDRQELAIVAFATLGALMAFLKYNYTPAKIFMGDTGSLMIGLVVSVLIIAFIDTNYELQPGHPYRFEGIPAVAFGIVIIPLFDTLRVFTTRIFRGQSPFQPDRRHIHHLLIDHGLSHMQATGLLLFVNVLFIVLVFSLHTMINVNLLLMLVLFLATLMTYFLHRSVLRHKRAMKHGIA